MSTRLSIDHDEFVVLSPEEARPWQLYLQHHQAEIRAEMCWASFDDVRPDREEYLAKKQAAGEALGTPRTEPPSVSDEMMADVVTRGV